MFKATAFLVRKVCDLFWFKKQFNISGFHSVILGDGTPHSLAYSYSPLREPAILFSNESVKEHSYVRHVVQYK